MILISGLVTLVILFYLLVWSLLRSADLADRRYDRLETKRYTEEAHDCYGLSRGPAEEVERARTR
jgi:hypothetical protein